MFVRATLARDLEERTFVPACDAWMTGHSPEYSRLLGERGWIGMTWPVEHGGRAATAVERYVVTEELLAVGAPVAAHWAGDRQVGPSLLRFGSREQQRGHLRAITEGRSYWAIGLSEPDAGSDLAAVRTKAVERGDGGFEIVGSKVWTSHAHRSHHSIVLCRTAPQEPDSRHHGLTQFIVDLPSDGITVRPIATVNGHDDFCEVFFDHVAIGRDRLVGRIGNGWAQVTAELAFERSGPERFMSVFPLFAALVRQMPEGDSAARLAVGALLSSLASLRMLSAGIARKLDNGEAPELEAALVKDLGTQFENATIEAARLCLRGAAPGDELGRLLAESVLESPSFTLRGGTTEILRSIVAKGLGRSVSAGLAR